MDLRCFHDLDLFAAETESPEEELEQDNQHRIVTRRGGNLDDPDGGLGLPEMLSGPFDPSVGPRTEAELRKDPRNAVVKATATDIDETSLTLSLDIETDEGELLRQQVTVP